MYRLCPALDRLPLRSLVRTLPPLRGLTVLNEQESRQNSIFQESINLGAKILHLVDLLNFIGHKITKKIAAIHHDCEK